MRELLGIEAPMELMTNNREKIEALQALGIPIQVLRPVEPIVSPWNFHYLNAKLRGDHQLGEPPPETRLAELPGPVLQIAPSAVDALPGVWSVASYLLPISIPSGVTWLRLYVYLDVPRGRDHVIFQFGEEDAEAVSVWVGREVIFERFQSKAAATKLRWLRALETFEQRGSGLATFLPAADLSGAAVDDETALALLRLHQRGRRAEALPGSLPLEPAPGSRSREQTR